MSRTQWQTALDAGVFKGSPVDIADGYIHFSTPQQVAETLQKHFSGQSDLVLLVVEEDSVPIEFRWEKSRGGELFPHLYADSICEWVVDVHELQPGNDGVHQLPDFETQD